MADPDQLTAKTPALEWIAAGVGLLLLAALLMIVGWDAFSRPTDEPAAVAIELGRPSRAAGGYVVPFQAVNSGGGDAAELQVEGQLVAGDRVIETSSAVIDYVPGSGRAEGGLFFSHDPKSLALRARPLGYQAP